MNDERFDNLTRSLANRISRRQVLKYLGGTISAGLLGLIGWKQKSKQSIGAGSEENFTTFLPLVTTPCINQTIPCPDCGTCTECNSDTVSNSATCYPCAQTCSSVEICVQANNDNNYQKLVCYLADKGFSFSSQSKRLDSLENGVFQRSIFSSNFYHTKDDNSTAYLHLGVEVTGELNSYALIYEEDKPIYGASIGADGQVQEIYPEQYDKQDIMSGAGENYAYINCQSCIKASTLSCIYEFSTTCATAGAETCLPLGPVASILCAISLGVVCGLLTSEVCNNDTIVSQLERVCCAGSGGENCCNNECVNINTDPVNCGGCNDSCEQCERCEEGICLSYCENITDCCVDVCCGANEKCCGVGEICIDISSDSNNCGGCGLTCDGCSQCVNGGCVSGCANGDICCDGMCVDAACGGCDVCPPGQICSNGFCCAPCSVGDPINGGCVNQCVSGQQCCNGVCWDFGCCDDGNGGKICCPEGCTCCGTGVGGGCQTKCDGTGEPCGAPCG